MASGGVTVALLVGGILAVDGSDEVGIEELDAGLGRLGYSACFCAGEGDVTEFNDN